jgi:hypothetical protein
MIRLNRLSGLLFLALPFAVAAAQEASVAIRGVVTDSVHHAPLAGAKIIASRTVAHDTVTTTEDIIAKTDAAGHFELKALAAAVYLLTVEHPWLDSTGFDVSAQTVDLRDGHSATVNLAVPSGATIRSAFCPGGARDTTVGLVEGHVRDALSGQPVGGVRVIFAWTDFTVDKRTARALPHPHTIAAGTARDGSFAACGLPIATKFLMQAQIGERSATGAVEVEIPTSGVLVETLRIATNKAGTTSVMGDVIRTVSQRPVPGAHIHVFGATNEVISADDGSFRLNDVPIGTQSIEVTSVGLKPRRYTIDVPPEGIPAVHIAVAEAGQVLDTVRSTARRNGAAALRDEFDVRANRGTGQYFTEAAIERMHPQRTTDLVTYFRGFEFRKDTVYSKRGDLVIGGLNSCKPVLLIDGSPADSMDEVLPVAIHGIEVYASAINVPLKYATAECGAIYIWTK